MDARLRRLLESVFEDEARMAAEGRPFTDLRCWDSLHYVQLVVAVQSVFGVELDRGQIQRITTLKGLQDVLYEHGISY